MNLPMPEYGKDDKETIEILMDTVVKLRKELYHLMYHLGDENIPDLPHMKTDITNNKASINVMEDEIVIMVGNINANHSAINVLESEIVLKVSKDGIISAINMSPEAISINAQKINLIGAVTVLSHITGSLGTITAGDIFGVNIYSANININQNVKIGSKLTLNGQTFGSGIEWDTGTMFPLASVYYDPGSEALHLNAAGGVYANGVKID